MSDKNFDKEYAERYMKLLWACENQRVNSDLSEIPVVCEEELDNVMNFDLKLDTEGTDLFFVLKEQEFDFDNMSEFADFLVEDEQNFDEFIFKAFDEVIQENKDVLDKWITYAKNGEKIRARKCLHKGVNGRVWKRLGDEIIEEDSQEMVLVLKALNEKIVLEKVYPI